jgi:hypothetical protein
MQVRLGAYHTKEVALLANIRLGQTVTFHRQHNLLAVTTHQQVEISQLTDSSVSWVGDNLPTTLLTDNQLSKGRGKRSWLGEPCPTVRLSQDRTPVEPLTQGGGKQR